MLDGLVPAPSELVARDQITFLGQDWAYGIAQEAALKMREAAQLWTEAYPQMEYRHGPIAIAEPGRAVWVFGRPVATCRATSSRPARSWSMTTSTRWPTWSGRSCWPYVVPSPLRLDPDQPRNLTRSVVLGEADSPDVIVSTRELVEQARHRRGAVAAVNVITLEHAEAIAAAATRTEARQ